MVSLGRDSTSWFGYEDARDDCLMNKLVVSSLEIDQEYIDYIFRKPLKFIIIRTNLFQSPTQLSSMTSPHSGSGRVRTQLLNYTIGTMDWRFDLWTHNR